MCRFCGLHSEITIQCEHESMIKERITVFRQKCVYCANRGEHIVTEIIEALNTKEKILFT